MAQTPRESPSTARLPVRWDVSATPDELRGQVLSCTAGRGLQGRSPDAPGRMPRQHHLTRYTNAYLACPSLMHGLPRHKIGNTAPPPTDALLYRCTYLDQPDPHAVAVVVDAVVVVVLVLRDDHVGRREQLGRPLAQHRHGFGDWMGYHATGKYVPILRRPCFHFCLHALGKYYPLPRPPLSGYPCARQQELWASQPAGVLRVLWGIKTSAFHCFHHFCSLVIHCDESFRLMLSHLVFLSLFFSRLDRSFFFYHGNPSSVILTHFSNIYFLYPVI